MSKTYLVGGAVRDHLLGHPVKDRDWVVVGATPQEMLDQGFTQVGADFPVFLHPETKEEYALARTERKTAPGYHGFEVDFDPTVTLEEDLERRDLTMNAMAVPEHLVDRFLNDPTPMNTFHGVVDPFRGRADLVRGNLRHVGDAFVEDPLRVLRLFRFAARYGFQIDQTTADLVVEMKQAGELTSLVPERVWVEVEKAVTEPYAKTFFGHLQGFGVGKEVLRDVWVSDTGRLLFRTATEFTGDMNAFHRMSALLFAMFDAMVESRAGLVVENEAFDGTVREVVEESFETLFETLKVPKQHQQMVRTLQLFRHFSFDTASDFLSFFHRAGWFRDRERMESGWLTDLLRTGSTKPAFMLRVLLPVLCAFDEVRDLSFADLTEEQRATLRGPAVGEAIDELRRRKLERWFFKEKLRG